MPCLSNISIQFWTSFKSAYFSYLIGLPHVPSVSVLPTHTHKGKASGHSVFQVEKLVIMTGVESVNRWAQCNSSAEKKKILQSTQNLFFGPRENYFLHQLAIQIKVPLQMILCPNYEIVTILLHSMTSKSKHPGRGSDFEWKLQLSNKKLSWVKGQSFLFF